MQQRVVTKFQSTHIPGTASFLNRCGDTTVSDG